MLKRIIKDIDVKEFIGLVLLFVGLVIYVIYLPGTVEYDNAKQVRITLSENPKYDEDIETGYDYRFTQSKNESLTIFPLLFSK
ncbi:hypothetical protein LVD17_21705 [Fulvivirga ulvae]|uniref:hypothetical protein n=1 Tax=Fulvivirga ulvae TaxID=2904245 RepID=UPI001F1F545D|nr:hypothetical protein [Fulvivirga ulvae]UII30913.1 hypothetical protein LVD17_21705 [Fulvivirga ulvae]